MKEIQHIVVLMLENRSFDNLLGFFSHPSDPSFKRLAGTENNPAGDGTPVVVSPAATGTLPFDPHHDHPSVTRQITKGDPPLSAASVNMQGFVLDAEDSGGGDAPRIMECFPPNGLPVLSALASEYAVADQWFCSVPGPTWPNRNFAHAATSDGRINNRPYKLYGNTTIYERLESAKATWRVYHDGFPQVLVFWRLLVGNRSANFQYMSDFYTAVKANALPNYSFIEPRHYGGRSNSQHPTNNVDSSRDMRAGEHLIWSIWNALISNPTVWAKTLFVITWDEHGGMYDHERPKPAVPPKKGMSTLGFKWNMTGVRVPAVLVSPWIRRSVVDHTPYDHASIPKSVRVRFAPKSKKLTERDAAAAAWWDANIWEAAMRTDKPLIPEPHIPAAPASVEVLAEPPSEDEEDLAWLAREVERVLDAKAAGVPVEVAVAAAQPAAMAEPPEFATKAQLAAYADAVSEKVR